MSESDSEHPAAQDEASLGESGHVLDLRVLQELRELGGEDDPGLIAELIEIYLADAPQRLQEISKGLDSGDLKVVERAAHTLKSSSANIGATGLSRICNEMEEIARQRKLDAIPPLFSRSKAVLSEVRSALRALQP